MTIDITVTDEQRGALNRLATKRGLTLDVLVTEIAITAVVQAAETALSEELAALTTAITAALKSASLDQRLRIARILGVR